MKVIKIISVKCIIIFILIAGYNQQSFSQQDNMIHLLPVIPQSAYTNPAFKPKAKFYIGFPALSSVYGGLAHNGFAYRHLIQRRADDSLELRMDNMIGKLANTNYVSANVSEEILAFGFKARKSYFSFSLSEKITSRVGYPKDLISLLWKGNSQFIGETMDLSGININAAAYHEISIGYMHDVRIKNQNFVFGGRIKMLRGLMNVYTQKNDLTIGIDDNDYAHTTNTGFQVNMCVPDTLAMNIDSINGKDTINEDFNFNPVDFFTNNSNKGFGIDLGVFYKLNSSFSFGASIVDLGYIKWQTGGGSSVRNYSSNVQDFVFYGIDFNDFFGKDDSIVKENFNEAMDSIADIFNVSTTKNSYKAPLPTKIYLTAIYTITKHDKVGLLMRGDFFNKRLYPSFTASYNKWFGNMLSAGVSYSVMNRSYMNLGFAMAFNLGPWQTYVATDNIYCLFDPEGARTANVHFGINFIFGYKEAKPNYSLLRDTPKESLK
ncbi:MAG TPA: DUF5723 family protein [Bacteroidales bacterium]|nr:DUF5723 family protein [Bacteroidales bacterium]HPS18369.1 DUF5723 family protein [Bacteroidales bacterium]